MKGVVSSKILSSVLIAAICIAVLPSCSLPEDGEQDLFRPEQVSCNVHLIPEARRITQEILSNPNGDLYYMAHEDEILAEWKKLADQGDPEAMFDFGDFKREFTEMGPLYGKNGSHKKRPFPDDVKNDIIIGTTYIYLSANFESQKKEDAQKLLHEIEGGGFDLTTPPEWIAEAKSNVERWKAYCARHHLAK